MHETKCDDKYIGIHMTHIVRFLSMQKQNDNLTLSLGLDKHMFVHVPWIFNVIYIGRFCVQWVKMKGDCLFN